MNNMSRIREAILATGDKELASAILIFESVPDADGSKYHGTIISGDPTKLTRQVSDIFNDLITKRSPIA